MDVPSIHLRKRGDHECAPTRRRRLWPWFLAGFATVFLGISLTVTAHTMHPSGRALVPTPLWQYYMIELRRTTTFSNLGPATVGFSAVIGISLLHALCSLAGGAVVAGTVWAARRLQPR